MTQPIRLSILMLGLVCSALGMYGAFEFAKKLEGNSVTYIALAAPVIAGAAAFIPPIAEATWRLGAPLKALFWWAALVPAGAVVFFSAAERVHAAKAGGQAERSALASAVNRADGTLTKVQAKLDEARAEANKARGQKQCGPSCRTKLSAETAAQADVQAAETALRKSQQVAVAESPLQAPVWLLPAALDVIAFMAIWTGLAGWRKAPAKEPARRRRRVVGKRKPRASKPRPLANDNVSFHTVH
jgi:hypothetical protein